MTSSADASAEASATRLPRSVRAAAAIAAAAVLAYGVLVLDWPVLIVMLLFWFENVVIGVFNVLRMLSAGAQSGLLGLFISLFPAAFFTLHYGLFTAAHGAVVLAVFGSTPGAKPNAQLVTEQLLAIGSLGGPVVLGAAVIVLMQAVEWFAWRLRGSGVQQVGQLMMAPYGRIVILHVALIFGAFLIERTGQLVAGALLLVALKLLADLLQIYGVMPGLRSRRPVVILHRGPRA